MTRTLSPLLQRCLERANPAVHHVVEFAVPDQAKVLHRAEDQFLLAPALLGLAPAASLVPSASGGVTLNSADEIIINQFTDTGAFGIPQENGGPSYVNTAAWALDRGFGGGILRSVTVRVRWTHFLTHPDISLRIFRAHRQAGVLQRIEGSSVVEAEAVQVTFTDLLPEPVVARYQALLAQGVIETGKYATVSFDLTPYRLVIDPLAPAPPGPADTGDLPEIYFTLQTNQTRAGNLVEWRADSTSARSIAGVGDMREVTWSRNADDPNATWSRAEFPRALMLKVALDSFVPTSVATYALALPAMPGSGSIGRVVFGAGTPRDASATLELSTTGASGPWAPVQDGDALSVVQGTYHARMTLNASADRRRAPVVSRMGIEFRSHVDLTAESTVDHVSQDVSVPFLAASVGEGAITAVRAGRRDYRDLAADLATAGPDTQLEADVFLAPRHPMVTRADWLQLSRASVSARVPTGTAERFTLLAATRAIKGKIPARIESITRRHTVVTSSTTSVQVTPDLQGASLAGNEYDARGYYIRVASSAVPELLSGTMHDVTGNTGVDRLDFIGGDELPAAFTPGDEIEVHSAQYLQPVLHWADADPADVWEEILVVHRNIPNSRLGRSDIGRAGRSGRPPRVTDRAPGDTNTQAKLRVSARITSQEEADALIDQLSFIMGGATVEIGGQIVFRQIYPLFDASGAMTVAPDPVAAVFDARDYTGLQTPSGREERVSVLACDYGLSPVAGDAGEALTLVFSDVDAVVSYGSPQGEAPAIPDDIARWCYNTADQGRFLAEQLLSQVVNATSTGLRVWLWTSVAARPELTVGDSVVVITDQYTDFDPATGTKVRGWNAYTLVLVSTSGGGRQFRGFLRGLRDVASVRLRGGRGLLSDNDPGSGRAGLSNVHDVQSDTGVTIEFTRGAAVVEVWAAYAVVTAGMVTNYDFATLVAPFVAPLPDGATSFPVPRPGDGQVTLVQLDPRLSDLVAGKPHRLTVTATPQVPHVELDDKESATKGTQWWKITERGIPVTAVAVQTQVGTEPISGFVAPTRIAGAVSVVRGGTLGAGEYEHDVTLDATRSSWIVPRLTLGNGAAPIVLGPFAFDRDRNPNIVSALVVSDRKLSVTGDTDTKSFQVFEGEYPWAAGRWKATRDGLADTIDLAATDIAGVAGLGSAASKLYTVVVYGAASGYVDGTTPYDRRTVTVAGATATAPDSVWETVDATAPIAPTSGAGPDVVTLRLDATTAPVGWTVAVFYGASLTSTNPDPMTDITSTLAPALGAPPTALTSYTYGTGYPASRAIDSQYVTAKFRVDLKDATGVVRDTRTVQANWNTVP